MSAKRITRVTLDEARRMESLTDWERVDKLTDEEIAAAAADDPDTVHPDDPWWREQMARGGVLVPPGLKKKRVTLPLDEDVVAWFRRQGRGWQHGVNHVLRRHMQDEERRRQGGGESAAE
jgi:uncharacterized protein (DUF4415 family)